MKTTTKQVFQSNNWIITKIMQGSHGLVRIDARTRYHIADADNFFSKWVSERYANKLARENYEKTLSNFSVYQY